MGVIPRPKECPDVKICKFPIPRGYYGQVCLGKYENCRIYAEHRKLLKIPFEWVQTIAVEQAGVVNV